jgi:hypothetical protein
MQNIKIHISILQVNAAAEVIYDLVDPNANLIFGAVVDESYSGQVQQQGRIRLRLFFMCMCESEECVIMSLLFVTHFLCYGYKW